MDEAVRCARLHRLGLWLSKGRKPPPGPRVVGFVPSAICSPLQPQHLLFRHLTSRLSRAPDDCPRAMPPSSAFDGSVPALPALPGRFFRSYSVSFHQEV